MRRQVPVTAHRIPGGHFLLAYDNGFAITCANIPIFDCDATGHRTCDVCASIADTIDGLHTRVTNLGRVVSIENLSVTRC